MRALAVLLTAGAAVEDDLGVARFEAAAGWDAATGLGTPRFEKLKAHVLALP